LIAAFANKKYNILLEKPMSVSVDECVQIHKAVTENNIILAVCHVLRYTEYTKAVKRILDSKILGDIINIQHLEPVGFWHFAHSFVRGNWNNEKDSTFSLLAKSCHDIDLLAYMMDSKCKASFSVYSFFGKIETKTQL
jgi:predicted dehydrogenase